MFNSLVKHFAGLVDSMDESVADERLLEDFLQSGVQVHDSVHCDWCADFTKIE